MIRIVNLTQHYGDRPVLVNLSLEIPTGELVTVLGPNGMGKSTLLAAMAGILAPQEGYVEFDGVRRRSSPAGELAIRKQVAYLPDRPWLPLSKTGRQFLMAVGELNGHAISRVMNHTERLLRAFNLDEQADWPLGDYSSGQQKKAALCAALVAEPRFLLLDEPFSGGLDPAGILALKRILKRLAEEGRCTIVMTTPVPELVEELSTRVAILVDGQIRAFDTVTGLKQLAHTEGGLDEVFQRLMDADTLAAIDAYLAPEKPL